MSEVAWNALMNVPTFTQGFERGLQNGQQRRVQEEEMAWKREQQKQQRAEWQRKDDYRTGTASMILSGGQNALMPRPAVPHAAGTIANPADVTPTGPNAAEPSAMERAVRADPEAFLTFQGKRLEVTAKDLKNYRDLNDTAMQLLGGVNDQATYDMAKKRAHALYSSYGQDASQFLSQLPAEYTPDTVESLRMQGMDSSKQMAAIARENRLEWDIEDDIADNERADRSTDSVIEYREERLEDYDAAEEARERRFRASEAGRNKRHSTPRPSTARGGRGSSGPSPTSVIGRIMDKQASGQALTPAEQKTYDEHRAGRGRSRGGAGAGRSAVIVNPKTGQRMQLEGGKWVPIK